MLGPNGRGACDYFGLKAGQVGWRLGVGSRSKVDREDKSTHNHPTLLTPHSYVQVDVICASMGAAFGSVRGFLVGRRTWCSTRGWRGAVESVGWQLGSVWRAIRCMGYHKIWRRDPCCPHFNQIRRITCATQSPPPPTLKTLESESPPNPPFPHSNQIRLLRLPPSVPGHCCRMRPQLPSVRSQDLAAPTAQEL